ncbi:hypothetical protein [Nocardioides euryhalodurans]|uniref:Septum formation initiator n=1 Tax=Nocardioides euryhalodurans TaxID=2518370 RepID=A0A4P7GLP9_9ACTN|nr:hypothetical protein [Nocardioides euryhalodurans]QBR93078.1 hypothetical protein EXE57_12980 [Nocardioides euryhalodurans]
MDSRRLGYVVAWIVAATLAVAVGIAAVSTVGASIRGRGPLGNEVVRDVGRGERVPAPDPEASLVEDSVDGQHGSFVVGCRGVVAYGLAAEPAPGWSVVSYEQGPDDDVDAVFSSRGRSIDIEVFCNQGEPTVAEIERNTLPDD